MSTTSAANRPANQSDDTAKRLERLAGYLTGEIPVNSARDDIVRRVAMDLQSVAKGIRQAGETPNPVTVQLRNLRLRVALLERDLELSLLIVRTAEKLTRVKSDTRMPQELAMQLLDLAIVIENTRKSYVDHKEYIGDSPLFDMLNEQNGAAS